MVQANGFGEAPPLYAQLLRLLRRHRVPFLVGGAYGLAHFTGICRPTKDLDIFVRRRHWKRLAHLAEAAGYRPELAFAHWLGKVHGDGGFVDVIFNSGNGLSPVDDEWFAHAPPGQLFGVPVKLMPVEETLWTKAFIMERERFDGADVAHLIHACAGRVDWQRLLGRFGPHWRVLLAHLVLFGFIYPGERARVPSWLMDDLAERLQFETHGTAPDTQHCAGTLLSREQYLPDLAHKGYQDSRLTHGTMTREDVAGWTAAIDEPPALIPTPTPRRRRRAA